MINAIQSAWREVKKTHFLFAVLFVSALICISSLETLLRLFPVTTLLEYDYHTNLIMQALHSDEMNSFIPIASGLPFAANYIEDIRSKFARYILIRSSFSSYITSRVVVCFFCGGLVVLTGILTTWGLAALLFGPVENKVTIVSTIRKEFFQTSIILCLVGGFWSVVGMAMSTFMESKYIAYSSPFVIYYLLIILCERYFSNIFIIYPKAWAEPSVWPYGWGGEVFFLMELTLLFVIVFAFRAERRLQQL